MTARDCKHGQLARSCPICSLEADNEQLRKQLADKDGEIAELTQYSIKGCDEEVDRLTNDLAAAQALLVKKDAALTHVRSIITDAAIVGFNYSTGDWAERIYASQAVTHAALSMSDKTALREVCLRVADRAKIAHTSRSAEDIVSEIIGAE